ncbi:PREDICTED: polymerase delta-interacting protein 2-like [Priapulus caudatus]|uniref:Polymerase delta-interacting protein 2-like n=1 Tax=Priapulus caudatus TaxID=37621 RepID=A0ABM1DZS2_PRICU|nr:PREDICTED: polymerase delta-interacting protein 2-like [Priapulus caudatus]
MAAACTRVTHQCRILLKTVSKQGQNSRRLGTSRLTEVGKLVLPKPEAAKYVTGELFLHKVFGYRGVILFPWEARVYDRDAQSQERPPTSGSYAGQEVKSKTHSYYQVLIDSRDSPYIRAQTEAVTFLGNQDNSRSLYAIPGLDYVSHDDILPYHTTEKKPLVHELFDRFLVPTEEGSETQFTMRDTLRAWQDKNHPWLELSDVHKETTENIRVTVIPFYMGSREAQNTHVYWWRYCIRLENLGDEVVQLRERHWRIFSLSGTLETVRGRGVIGQEPLLTKQQSAFQYSSHVSLQAPSGHMWGTFRMERQDGYSFDCKIPPFSLESKEDSSSSTPTNFT